MPADPITPGLAAAWNNGAPGTITPGGAAAWNNGEPSRVGLADVRLDAVVRAPANLASLATVTGAIDGVRLFGLASTRQQRAVLLTAQSTQTQNGLYVAGTTGANVGMNNGVTPAIFDDGGQWVKTGLTPGRLYYWQKGVFETSVENDELEDVLTDSGFIEADGEGQLFFTGTPLESLEGSLREANLVRADAFNESAEMYAGTVVRVNGGTGAPKWWRLLSTITQIGTDAVTFETITVTSATPPNSNAFNNGAASGITPGTGSAFDNTAPATKTPVLTAAWDNTGATSKTV